MTRRKRILILDFTNYEDYPMGGYLSFARSMIESFNTDIALVGITTCADDPLGRWYKKNINGSLFDFFAIARYSKSKTRHIIPDRLVSYVLIKFYRPRIFKINIANIFIQRQEMLLAVSGFKAGNICYCFAGLENPLSISKYKYAPFFSKWFERAFFRRLKVVKSILASGDSSAIKEMISRSRGVLSECQVVKFPTRINTHIFRPSDRKEAREKLNLPQESTILITTGRIAQLKGWNFLIDCFKRFEAENGNSLMLFIGEGEDQVKLEDYISQNKLVDKVILTGRKSIEEVSMYLNASDLFIMGSFKEGWSTALIEAIACGLPACVTDFSSAREIIEEGKNGFVVKEHDPDLFVQYMLKALQIPRPVRNDHVLMLSSDKLKSELLKHWELI
jgi:glycosyltransferase involved in cell wall biosynthesis